MQSSTQGKTIHWPSDLFSGGSSPRMYVDFRSRQRGVCTDRSGVFGLSVPKSIRLCRIAAFASLGAICRSSRNGLPCTCGIGRYGTQTSTTCPSLIYQDLTVLIFSPFLAPTLLHSPLSTAHSCCDVVSIDWRGAEQRCIHLLIGLFGEIAAPTAGRLTSHGRREVPQTFFFSEISPRDSDGPDSLPQLQDFMHPIDNVNASLVVVGDIVEDVTVVCLAH
ncbi:hypothetical protein MN608_06640 [Microdochium nivale]|nr:hypothetical protein MN608_06640 [Microdochium nivale]